MSVTPIVGVTSTPRMSEYMSGAMFKTHGRRGVMISQIVPKGRVADQDGALLEYIDAASSWMDHLCQQILTATSDTVLDRVNVDRNGYATVHPRYRPVIALEAFAIGPYPDQMTAFTDLSGVGVRLNSFSVPANMNVLPVFTNQGPLQLGGISAPMTRAWCQYTYQNGYPVTALAAPIVAGDTHISLLDTTGIVQGNTWLTIYTDPGKRTTFLAGAVSTAPSGGVGTGPGTVGCPTQAWAVSNVGPYPVMVSALPKDAIDACALATRAFIKDANPAAATGGEKASSPDDDLAEAAGLLRDYVAPIE